MWPLSGLTVLMVTPLVGLFVWVRRRRLRAVALLGAREPLSDSRFAQQFFPESGRRLQLARELRALLRRHYPTSLDGLRPDDDLIRDLRLDDFDSLASVELLLDIEQEYDVQLPEDRLAHTRTFRELVDLVEGSLATRRSWSQGMADPPAGEA